MAHALPIQKIRQVTHDVKQFTFPKPEGYDFSPGQATEVSIDKDGWREEKRPFTFTSLPEQDHLEFTIKIYPEHEGVTHELDKLQEGDQLLIDEPWGTIEYKGPGVFLAGGAGVTPLISIFRHLDKKGELSGNTLIFSNKTEQDIILREEFEQILGDQFLKVITQSDPGTSDSPNLTHLEGFIDREYLDKTIDDFSRHFYVCGPPAFNDAMLEALKVLGADPDALVFEE
jgi:ferredoxin-NADP reductase